MAFTVIPPAGGVLTAATLSGLVTEVRPLTARRTSTSSPVSNSTTLVNDSALVLPVEANAVYELRGNFLYSTAAAANIKFGWTFPTGLTMSYLGSTIPAGQTTWQSFALIQTDPLAADDSPGIARVEGLVMVGLTPGNLQVQFAQNTANVSNTTLNAGSYVCLNRLD
ncbi:hypothetical protein Drose_04110 [Dactylosporangium roseum]|uniref:Uncharacterized protein n=1 Tax=Dactylosporangium roseum TaxID=47989 RepID=A0ABY5Z9T8_9ACTN|nr:hypothetical protein [Dactylosporangium roseum]UWZ37473.1 hypothetical protein Drose_04110 [Dactylosporangium roseum]